MNMRQIKFNKEEINWNDSLEVNSKYFNDSFLISHDLYVLFCLLIDNVHKFSLFFVNHSKKHNNV